MNRTSYVVLAVVVAACGDDHAGPIDAAPHPKDVAPSPDVAMPDAPPADPVTLTLGGATTPVHDPSIAYVDGLYMVFSTGTGLPVRTSVDLINWSLAGQVFATAPSWISTNGSTNDLWAPDISNFGGTYHLYYAASSFGSNTSCIGHATSASPTSGSWTDQGAVICSTSTDNWNAIDPAAFVDTSGNAWLAFGSFWSGLKLIPLNPDGTRAGTEMISLATRNDTAVEAPFVVHHGGYYYLFESVGRCCQGVNSTYKVLVGRSTEVRGPYLDDQGVALLAGGGKLVVDADAQWKGPGHNAVLTTSTDTYNVYHSYDAAASGTPTLRISQMRWSADGWPISAGP
ncbi:MAG: arabinan endo-1,5-alpha-L-arabinosidase [Kofleriaceae bacterium]|nr:arabinan endo-1,5-alpha-L-arabinosidase [Kofleriaceae bacterium]